jgi:hypothetical protein
VVPLVPLADALTSATELKKFWLVNCVLYVPTNRLLLHPCAAIDAFGNTRPQANSPANTVVF